MRTTCTQRGQHSLLEAPAAMAHNLTQSILSFGDDSSPGLLHTRNDVSLVDYCWTTNPSLIPRQMSLVVGCYYSAASDRNTSHTVCPPSATTIAKCTLCRPAPQRERILFSAIGAQCFWSFPEPSSISRCSLPSVEVAPVV